MKTLFASIAAFTISAPVFGALSIVSQNRTVNVYADGNPAESQSFTAPDFLPFSATAQVTTGNGSASATQNSSLNTDGFTLSASCTGSGQNAYTVYGTSLFDVTFSLDVPTPYSLTGTLGANGGPGNVTLSQNATTMYESFGGSIESTGLLQAGTYRLQGQITASNRPGFDPPSGMNMTFSIVPAPGTIGAIGLAGVLLTGRRRRFGNEHEPYLPKLRALRLSCA